MWRILERAQAHCCLVPRHLKSHAHNEHGKVSCKRKGPWEGFPKMLRALRKFVPTSSDCSRAKQSFDGGAVNTRGEAARRIGKSRFEISRGFAARLAFRANNITAVSNAGYTRCPKHFRTGLCTRQGLFGS